MSFAPRNIASTSRSALRVSTRYNSTSSPSSSSTSKPPSSSKSTASTSSPRSAPPLTASLLLSRQPLLLRTQTPLQKAYYAHTLSLRHALSNPTPLEFYFRPGSLPLRRFVASRHQYEVEKFGKKIAGKMPEIGDIPGEIPIEEVSRDKWEREDQGRGEKSLERYPEEEVFCLVKERNGGRWGFPNTEVLGNEGLDEAVMRGLVGVEGGLGGGGMDSWLVTRKPVGVVREGEKRTFFLRSHILADEPARPTDSTPWTDWAWLTTEEVEARLTGQGDGKLWEGVRGMFGVGEGGEDELE